MLPALPRLAAGVARCSLLLALAGCGDPAPPAAPPATPKTGDATKTPPPATDAKEAPPVVTPPPTVPAEPEPVGAAVGEDWLVWYSQGGQWVTRWIDATPSESTLVAERRALVVSDGARLWRVARKDGEVDVSACNCLLDEEEREPDLDCKPRARLVAPGLHGVELVSGKEVIVRPPQLEAMYGEDIDRSLEIVGGAGPRLFIQWGESGYMCGAHGLTEGGVLVFDLAAGEVMKDALGPIGSALPAAVREPAATEIRTLLVECDGDDAPTLRQVLDERMGLTGVSIALADGAPRITWSFETDTYYTCSIDYASHGAGESGLVAAGAPLGLEGPLPKGVEHALVQIGQAPALGWARLSLSAEARAAALAAFRRADETPWPATFAAERPVAVSDTQARRQAKAKLDEGRKLTRAGDYPTAIAAFDAAIELDRALARAWSERGYAKLLSGDLEGAQADLTAALPLDEGAPYWAAVHYNLGLVAEKRGDPSAARTAFEASLALRENESVRKALARLK